MEDNSNQQQNHQQKVGKKIKFSMSEFKKFKMQMLNEDGTLNRHFLNENKELVEQWKHWINKEWERAKEIELKVYHERDRVATKYEIVSRDLEVVETAKMFLEK